MIDFDAMPLRFKKKLTHFVVVGITKVRFMRLAPKHLMRSRFSAYVLRFIQYIYRTWDKNTRPPLNVLREKSAQKFTKLEIINTSQGDTDDETGTVEFIAKYTLDNHSEIHQHHENSYFIKQRHRWVYVDTVDKIDKARDSN